MSNVLTIEWYLGIKSLCLGFEAKGREGNVTGHVTNSNNIDIYIGRLKINPQTQTYTSPKTHISSLLAV